MIYIYIIYDGGGAAARRPRATCALADKVIVDVKDMLPLGDGQSTPGDELEAHIRANRSTVYIDEVLSN